MHDWNWVWIYGSLFVAAFLAGAINAVAGGGTLLTFPTLLAVKTPDVIANATSTMALVPGSAASAWGFRRELRESWRWLILLFLPSLLGGLTGALLLTRTDPSYFKLVIPWLLLFASLLFLVQPRLARWAPPHPESGLPSIWVRIAVTIFQFFVSVYGGYFGAGIGILMLSSLGFMGIGDINRLNSVKTILAAVINAASVVVFIVEDKIDWRYAPVMAVASIFGGYYGAVIGRRLPRTLVRGFVVTVGLALAGFYFLQQAGVVKTG